MKNRPLRDRLFKGFREEQYKQNKQKLYERQGHRCPHCGQVFELADMECHHVLPVGRFMELQWSIRNMMLLCRYCHKEVHMNPFLEIRMMEEKARELGVDLMERYKCTQMLPTADAVGVAAG